MFDEMVIRTNFMKRCISNVLSAKFKQQSGKDINITLRNLEAHTNDDEITVKLDGTVRMKLTDFEELLTAMNKGT